MSDKKICPLTYDPNDPDYNLCVKESCAWWIKDEPYIRKEGLGQVKKIRSSCAIVIIAKGGAYEKT